jgi:hypothetical protein
MRDAPTRSVGDDILCADRQANQAEKTGLDPLPPDGVKGNIAR